MDDDEVPTACPVCYEDFTPLSLDDDEWCAAQIDELDEDAARLVGRRAECGHYACAGCLEVVPE